MIVLWYELIFSVVVAACSVILGQKILECQQTKKQLWIVIFIITVVDTFFSKQYLMISIVQQYLWDIFRIMCIIVAKYDGKIQYEDKENCFEAFCMIPLAKDKI